MRPLFVLLFIVNPYAATLFYILAWIVIPEEPEKPVAEEAEIKDQGTVILGLILIAVGLLAFPKLKIVLKNVIGVAFIALGFLLILATLTGRRKEED